MMVKAHSKLAAVCLTDSSGSSPTPPDFSPPPFCFPTLFFPSFTSSLSAALQDTGGLRCAHVAKCKRWPGLCSHGLWSLIFSCRFSLVLTSSGPNMAAFSLGFQIWSLDFLGKFLSEMTFSSKGFILSNSLPQIFMEIKWDIFSYFSMSTFSLGVNPKILSINA